MPRPMKHRWVEFFPEHTYYAPRGIRACELEEIELKLEELEAMRLKDIEQLTQEECAERMGISRQTFQNIIDSARRKVAIALTQGQALHIGGGHYRAKHCFYQCQACSHQYYIENEEERTTCPSCGSHQVQCIQRHRGKHCQRWCQQQQAPLGNE